MSEHEAIGASPDGTDSICQQGTRRFPAGISSILVYVFYMPVRQRF
jgi:hypothetical protein